MKQKFNITGMTCSSCSSHVEKAVNNLDGAEKVNVNLLSNNMIVEYDNNITNDKEIIKAVVDSGYGASLANSEEKKEKTNNDNDELKSMKKRLVISIIFLIPIMYISMHHMLKEWFGIPVPVFIKNIFHGTENAINFSFSQFILLLPILFVNWNYFKVGFKALFKRTPNMDSLIAIGSSAAVIYGIVAIFRIGYGLGHGDLGLVQKYSMDIYFESAGTILTLITLGKYLETKSKGKTSEAITKLINLAPKTAYVIRDGKEIQVELEDVILRDVIVVRPGSSIPVDGVIIEGSSSVDQSAITGESIPVEKNIGDTVIAGTINKSGFFKFKAQKVGSDTTLAQIIQLLEDASNSKAPIAKLADKISGIFVPIVIAIAILAAIIWLLLGQSFEFALSIGIAILVISCPCALGLATPVAIMVGTGKGAEYGILIKSAESLETLHLVDTVVFDKTGTITEGKPQVTDIVPKSNFDNNKLLFIASSLEKKSEHPLADAIIEKAKLEDIKSCEVDDFISISGRGIKGKINDEIYFGGNLAFMEENKIDLSDIKEIGNKFAKEGKTPLYFANENKLIGLIVAQDVVKKNSKRAIEELKQMDVDVIMLTGDNKVTAEAIRKNLSIDKVISEVLPQDKESEISNLQKNGKKVAMCGDGINDSPALVRADVGIAIGSGTDIAIESADVVLMKNDLLDVVTAIKLSKNVIKNIKMNLFWAFFYNTIGIPLAAGIFYNILGWKLNPMFGAAAMSLSSLCVVTNALRIKNFKPNFKYERKENFKMEKIIFVEGMQCEHCKKTVEETLLNIDGIKSAEVNLEEKVVTIGLEKEIELEILKQAVESKGYKVISIK